MNNKKNIQIDETLYEKIKNHCDNEDIKISRWISKILANELNNPNPCYSTNYCCNSLTYNSYINSTKIATTTIATTLSFGFDVGGITNTGEHLTGLKFFGSSEYASGYGTDNQISNCYTYTL